MTQLRVAEPTDEETFQHGLTEFVEAAKQNGVTVDRAWQCLDGRDAWEVEIVPLAMD